MDSDERNEVQDQRGITKLGVDEWTLSVLNAKNWLAPRPGRASRSEQPRAHVREQVWELQDASEQIATDIKSSELYISNNWEHFCIDWNMLSIVTYV